MMPKSAGKGPGSRSCGRPTCARSRRGLFVSPSTVISAFAPVLRGRGRSSLGTSSWSPTVAASGTAGQPEAVTNLPVDDLLQLIRDEVRCSSLALGALLPLSSAAGLLCLHSLCCQAPRCLVNQVSSFVWLLSTVPCIHLLWLVRFVCVCFCLVHTCIHCGAPW